MIRCLCQYWMASWSSEGIGKLIALPNSCQHHHWYFSTVYMGMFSLLIPVYSLLFWQLKDMAERRIPEGSVVGSQPSSIASHVLNILNLASGDNHRSYLAASHESKPNDHLSNLPFCRGSNSPTEEAEWVEHDETGVYITLSSLPGGGKEIKRVRFRYRHNIYIFFSWDS